MSTNNMKKHNRMQSGQSFRLFSVPGLLLLIGMIVAYGIPVWQLSKNWNMGGGFFWSIVQYGVYAGIFAMAALAVLTMSYRNPVFLIIGLAFLVCFGLYYFNFNADATKICLLICKALAVVTCVVGFIPGAVVYLVMHFVQPYLPNAKIVLVAELALSLVLGVLFGFLVHLLFCRKRRRKVVIDKTRVQKEPLEKGKSNKRRDPYYDMEKDGQYTYSEVQLGSDGTSSKRGTTNSQQNGTDRRGTTVGVQPERNVEQNSTAARKASVPEENGSVNKAATGAEKNTPDPYEINIPDEDDYIDINENPAAENEWEDDDFSREDLDEWNRVLNRPITNAQGVRGVVRLEGGELTAYFDDGTTGIVEELHRKYYLQEQDGHWTKL